MNEAPGGGNQRPCSDQEQDQTWGSVFNDPTAPLWDEPTAPAPTPRADQPPSEPVVGAPSLPPERPAPPAPPGAEHRSTGAAYRNRGAAYRSRYEAYRNGRKPATSHMAPRVAAPMSGSNAQQFQQSPVQQHVGPPDQYVQPRYKTLFSANTWTILTILSLLGPGRRSFGSLADDFMHLNRSSRDPRSSRGLNNAGGIVFAVACIVGFVGYIVHTIFPF
jgi:hypothetical protein